MMPSRAGSACACRSGPGGVSGAGVSSPCCARPGRLAACESCWHGRVRAGGRSATRGTVEMAAGPPDYFEREPCVMRFANGYIVLNGEGGPTDDKPDVQAQAPPDSSTLGSAMNIRVTDVHAVYEQWRSRGGEFLTEPKVPD